ncbi:MAG: hypothetical protein WA730_25390 [Pseudolabrys sp.]
MPKEHRNHPLKKRAAVFSLSDREKAIVQNWEALPYLPPKLTAIVENCGMSTVYERLADGTYQAVKDGPKTQIFTTSIKARRLSLRPAQYRRANEGAAA